MINLPNILSFLRLPLAFLFLQESTLTRVLCIALAMITDWLDGFLARRYRQTSSAGRLLDPLTDKFFVCFILSILIKEGQIKFLEALSFFARDASVFIFGSYLLYSNKLKDYIFRPFWSGKIVTTIQLFMLLGLALKIAIPSHFFWILLLLGTGSLIELFVYRTSV